MLQRPSNLWNVVIRLVVHESSCVFCCESCTPSCWENKTVHGARVTFSSSTLVTGKLNVICLYEEKTWPQWLKKTRFLLLGIFTQ